MVARSCTSVAREAGAVFVREGQTSHEFVLIVSGTVAVMRQGLPDVVLGSDEWFGDIELLSNGTSFATVTALTDVECIVMSRPEFTCVFDAVPSFRKRVVRSVASIARDSVGVAAITAMAAVNNCGHVGSSGWNDLRAAGRVTLDTSSQPGE